MSDQQIWKEAIREIRLAQRSNRLVLFVGAGVSANSGIPTWENLIRKIAVHIGYDNCHKCKNRHADCPRKDCHERYSFSQSDFVRIPDYFYDSFPEDSKNEYYQFLEDALKIRQAKPNPIDDELFRILPHHLITTNFDSLLEDSTAANRGLYEVIRQDRDLLTHPSDKYIIKMHGDLQIPDSVVLKDGDYLEYENSHPLISAFIRSLLINHTFVFLGYGLNDYNLNLIIGWINYFRKNANITGGVRNFLITDKIPVSFEKRRLEHQGITVISLNDLPDELAEDAPASISDPRGRKLYAFVKSISTPSLEEKFLTLSEILLGKYQDFEPYKKIAIPDFLGAYNYKDAKIRFERMEIFNRQEFENLKSLLKKSPLIASVFTRTGIESISWKDEQGNKEEIHLEADDFLKNPLFQLEMNQDYVGLAKRVQESGTLYEKLYYAHISGIDPKQLAQMSEEQMILDPLQTLINKVRAYYGWYVQSAQKQEKEEEISAIFRALPIQRDYSVRFLRYLFEYPSQNRNKMEGLLRKIDLCLDPDSASYDVTQAWKHFDLLRSYAYDYILFLKANLIPLDHLKESEDYIRPYIRAMVSLSRKELQQAHPDGIHQGVILRLSPLDLDLIIRFSNPYRLRRAFRRYRTDVLLLEETIDLSRLINNLTNSLKESDMAQGILLNQLYPLLVIYFHQQPSIQSRTEILTRLANLLSLPERCSLKMGMVPLMEYVLYKTTQDGRMEPSAPPLAAIADYLCSAEGIRALKREDPSRVRNLIVLASRSVSDQAKAALKQSVLQSQSVSEALDLIERYGPVLDSLNLSFDMDQLLSKVRPRQFRLLVEQGFLKLDDASFDQIISWLNTFKDKVTGKVDQDGSQGRMLKQWLRQLVSLHVHKGFPETDRLKEFAGDLDQVDFLLDPEYFDYGRVVLSDTLWQQLIWSKKYRLWFEKNARALINKSLKKRFEDELESVQEEKIVYGLLLDQDELENFADTSGRLAFPTEKA